jgi:1-acyl-sn-glycerol-3-phosphate acyltransferase
VLRTLFFYITFFPWTFLSAIIALLTSLISPEKTHQFVHFWGRICLFLAGLKIEVKGSENIPPDGPAIYVSNHQSNFDIPIIYSGLPIPFNWLAKKELFKIPLFGLGMKRNGNIPIDRSNRKTTIHSIIIAAQRIKEGTSVVIFPEGTRTPDGDLQEFKKGALLIAAKAQVPVVPIVIHGSYIIQPKDRWRIEPGTVVLEILPPLPTNDLKTRDIDQLTEKIHRLIAASLQGASAHA